MATIYELKRRAQELSAKKDSLSISPEEVGGLIDETLDVINEAEKNQIGLGIRNTYTTVAEMNAQCRRLNNLGLVMIDYLQLMQGSGSKNSWASESRQQVVSDISRMMKIMAKELNVPVLCLSQLSRANEQRQAPDALGSARVRLDRAGRRHRHGHLPRRLLQPGDRKPESHGADRAQKPPRRDRQGQSPVAGRVYNVPRRRPLAQ